MANHAVTTSSLYIFGVFGLEELALFALVAVQKHRPLQTLNLQH